MNDKVKKLNQVLKETEAMVVSNVYKMDLPLINNNSFELSPLFINYLEEWSKNHKDDNNFPNTLSTKRFKVKSKLDANKISFDLTKYTIRQSSLLQLSRKYRVSKRTMHLFNESIRKKTTKVKLQNIKI